MYIAYLDEFGHDGPFISRKDSKYKESPVFGLAGFVLPLQNVRYFSEWFLGKKCDLLGPEMANSIIPPDQWEKKGSSLYTVKNIWKYLELKYFTHRLLKKIEALGGVVFYTGIEKETNPGNHDSNKLYFAVLRMAVSQLGRHFDQTASEFLLALDEHTLRSEILTHATQVMQTVTNLIEPPFQLESHRYQTMQVADWLAGLIGRICSQQVRPHEYADNEVFQENFKNHLDDISIGNEVRKI